MTDSPLQIALERWNEPAYYKTAALPTELIRQTGVYLGFSAVRVKPERAKDAKEA